MPILPIKSVKRPWIQGNDGKRQSTQDNAFYHTSTWKRVRLLVLKTEPLCRSCRGKGKISAATTVDHIIPVRKGGEMYSMSNLQPLCDSCHASKSGKEAHG
jgi:5-methylcytosine-specific restriction enzyme A